MKHYEESIQIMASSKEIFDFADEHKNFSSHMNKSSLMLGGGSMITEFDDGGGKTLNSHITMRGKAFGIPLYLDEVITIHEPPFSKEWRTVGNIKLIVIGHYILGFEIIPLNEVSKFRVFIDYDYPESLIGKILCFLLGGAYAKWCVRNMISGVSKHFKVL